MGFAGLDIQGPDALQQVGRIRSEMGIKRPVTVCDAIVGDPIWPQLPLLMKSHGLNPVSSAMPNRVASCDANSSRACVMAAARACRARAATCRTGSIKWLSRSLFRAEAGRPITLGSAPFSEMRRPD